jgi:hypothetical protein
MTFLELALAGAADGRIVNLTDEAPMSIYEIAEIVGTPIKASGEPLPNPWGAQMDGSLARSLGFQAKIATIQQAIREGAL